MTCIELPSHPHQAGMSAFLVGSRFARPGGLAKTYANMANRRAPAKPAARRERWREASNRLVFNKSKPHRSNAYLCPASASFAGPGGFGAAGAGAGVCFGGGAGALGGGAGRAAGRPLYANQVLLSVNEAVSRTVF